MMTNNRYYKFAVAAIIASAASGQAIAAQGIRGTFNPRTGIFTAARPAVKPAAPTTALTTINGTFKISVSVHIQPKIPSNVTLSANLAITAQDPATYNPALSYTTNVSSNLARNGALGTATFIVPFNYQMADPHAPVTFVVTVAEVIENANGQRLPTTAFLPTDSHTTTIAMPANGSTTSVTIGDTI